MSKKNTKRPPQQQRGWRSAARRIQLVFADTSTDYKALVGKDIRVKGALWHAMTGGHYTDVVIFVDSIELKKEGRSATRRLT